MFSETKTGGTREFRKFETRARARARTQRRTLLAIERSSRRAARYVPSVRARARSLYIDFVHRRFYGDLELRHFCFRSTGTSYLSTASSSVASDGQPLPSSHNPGEYAQLP